MHNQRATRVGHSTSYRTCTGPAEVSYEIVPIDPTVVFIVTLDDQPLHDADGQTLRFYREVDAQRCIDELRGRRW